MADVLSAARRSIAGYALFGAFWGAWGGVLPAVQEHANASDGQLGAALAMIGFGALLSMRLTGALIDRFGPVVLPITAVAFGAVAATPGMVTSPVVLAAVLLMLGAASGAMDVAISATGVAAEADTGRPLLNLGNAAFSGAVVIASLAAGAARAAGASALAVLATVGAVVVLVALAVLRAAPGEAIGRQPRSAVAGRRLRRPRPALLVLGGLGMLAYLVENAWQSWGAVQLHSTLAASPATAAAAPAVFATSAALGRLAGNHALTRLTAARLVTAGAVVAAGGSVLGALAPNAPLALVGIAFAGLGTSVCAPTLISVAGAWAGPVGRAGATSTVVTLAYIGFLIGPALVGLVAAATTLPTALGVVAVVAAGLALAAPAALRPGRVRSAAAHTR